MSPEKDIPFVSRAGLKLDHALTEFAFDVTGLVCADFGCNVGGFTDCLLQRGAKLVYAIDTGYGTLAWKLRSDDRVIVMERTNALHVKLPSPSGRGVGGEGFPDRKKHDAARPSPNPLPPPDKGEGYSGVDLVTIDLAWTQQRHAIPAALRWLRATPEARIISLIKPHYELDDAAKKTLLTGGALDPAEAQRINLRVLDAMPALGAKVISHTKSPLTGRKSSRNKPARGNVEYLVLLSSETTPANCVVNSE